MKKYIGVKIITAEPMKLGEYNKLRGVCVDKDDAHYDDAGYKIVYSDDYMSWSPKAVFEEAYRTTMGMNFGLAIEAMKKGYKVRRKGWNGKGIHIALHEPKDAGEDMTHPYIYIDTTRLISENPDAPRDRVPWLASQTDMLADDWVIVE